MKLLTGISNTCSDPALAKSLSFLHQIFNIICIIVPILLIVFASFSVIKLMINPEEKKGNIKIMNKVLAAIVIFLVPAFLNVVMHWVEYARSNDQKSMIFNVAACWNNADKTSSGMGNPTYDGGSTGKKGSHTLMSFMGDLSGLKKYVEASGLGSAITLPGGMPIPIYYQNDYADVSLKAGRTVATAGCGFTSGAMVASYLLDQKITPRELIDSWSRAYYIPGSGMSWGFPAALAKHYNLGSVRETTSKAEVLTALKNNQPVMCSQTAGLFTRGGHIIVLRGLDENGKVYVNDPNKNNAVGKGYNARVFDMSTEIHPTALRYWIFKAKEAA